MSSKNLYVVPLSDGWAVKPDGGKRPSSVGETQQEAIDRGLKFARHQGTELFIHKRGGRIRERDSHGRDPFSPKG